VKPPLYSTHQPIGVARLCRMGHVAGADRLLSRSDLRISRQLESSLCRMSYRSEVVCMGRSMSIDDIGSLSGWLDVTPTPRRVRCQRLRAVVDGVRFAFYGRMSTSEYQDAGSSRAWQLDSARQTIAGRGRVMAEFFDVGWSRRVPWAERPGAAALLAAATSLEHPFDAVVVGEYERAFHGDQLN
jgi:hypothetical protein